MFRFPTAEGRSASFDEDERDSTMSALGCLAVEGATLQIDCLRVLLFETLKTVRKTNVRPKVDY